MTMKGAGYGIGRPWSGMGDTTEAPSAVDERAPVRDDHVGKSWRRWSRYSAPDDPRNAPAGAVRVVLCGSDVLPSWG
ncbi:MAG: hypothetical protein FWF75_04325 [Propionibacteriaceae bacterium]|nr:hypothetical protein [Propionibacteriaceae bacterium]